MRVLFIYPEVGWSHVGISAIHFGLAYLISYLKHHGHDCRLLRLDRADCRDFLLERIAEHKPDIVGISSGTNQWPFARDYGKWIREETRIPIIYGGWHPTLAPEDVLKLPYADYVCVGEGELPMLEFLRRMENGRSVDDIPGLWVRRGSEVIRNSVHPLLSELDALPFMDLDAFDYGSGKYNLGAHWAYNYTLQMTAGRGCPYSCTFCCAKAFRDLYKSAGAGSYVRIRLPERVIEEVEYHLSKYPFIDSIYFITTVRLLVPEKGVNNFTSLDYEEK